MTRERVLLKTKRVSVSVWNVMHWKPLMIRGQECATLYVGPVVVFVTSKGNDQC